MRIVLFAILQQMEIVCLYMKTLDFGLSVVATDVVDRPHGVYTVKRNDMDELFIVLKNLSKLKNERKHVMLNLKGLALIQFYDKIIAELK